MATTEAQASAQALQDDIQPRHTDKQIWGIYIALCLISIVELYSASAHEVHINNVLLPVMRHIGFLFFGLLIMLGLQSVHYRNFLKIRNINITYLFAFLSWGAMFYTLLWGDKINGARRSFDLFGIIPVQPAEMVKVSVALMIAALLSKNQMRKNGDVTAKGLWLVAATVAIPGILFIFQGLTNTLLLVCISGAMMIVGGVSLKKIGLLLAVALAVALVGVGVMSVIPAGNSKQDQAASVTLVVPGTDITVGHEEAPQATQSSRLLRLQTWINRLTRHKEKDKYNVPITSENQQEQYSYLAQAHGGVLGVMPGNSRETARLPLAFSDYIYAIIIEELGLVGGILVLILYLWLLARAGRIANRCQTAYPALLVIGMAVFIAFQALFHMAIVTGVFPVSGQPLPLISKGGTSILITSMALGIMLSVSRFAARKGKKAEIKEELNALPDEVSAANPV